jgi:ubiquinone/menaquinone biosynthesis C-methylase UbiE
MCGQYIACEDHYRYKGKTILKSTLWVDVMNESRVGRYMHAVEQAMIAKHLPTTPQQVLDLGGGTGRWSQWLLERQHHQTMLEISRANLKGFLRDHASMQAVQADAQAIPFESAHFDAVIAVQLYGMLEDDQAFFSEIQRVLKPGGWLFISWTNRRSLKGLMYETYSYFKGSRREDMHKFYHFSHQETTSLMQSHGLYLVEAVGYSWVILPRGHNSPLVDLFVGLERGLGLTRLVNWSPNIMCAVQKLQS